ncbi:hypothetical protein SAMN04488498_11427 [Mesorhizobium albiziae]|uniref:Uncharacterized protein n=1 Tax=Neomesorhizobium albiziae TaxID=335020 RepID=A0A1I4CQL4_9HYPH|nr:hypothetical protein [Mesorhizobium albiziae]GLS30949.1 hypothetical protein GCM10007937_26580 [Mesorhizobium albiziae]SFK83195.1 hypothetical protein SAMN04488498_11427 [Mesorhizobium albiziae]
MADSGGPFPSTNATLLAIRKEIYLAFDHLDASPELLAIIGEWGRVKSDEETLNALSEFNRRWSHRNTRHT